MIVAPSVTGVLVINIFENINTSTQNIPFNMMEAGKVQISNLLIIYPFHQCLVFNIIMNIMISNLKTTSFLVQFKQI